MILDLLGVQLCQRIAPEISPLCSVTGAPAARSTSSKPGHEAEVGARISKELAMLLSVQTLIIIVSRAV